MDWAKRNGLVTAGIVATIGYAGVMFWVLFVRIGADGDGECHRLHCLSLNELGDFLAGAFAPLAFLWLVLAVFIQSRELNAQRLELALTRQEVKDNREVMKEQANEARRSAEFIGQQTAILHAEQNMRIASENEKEALTRISRVSSLCAGDNMVVEIKHDQGSQKLPINSYIKADDLQNLQRIVTQIIDAGSSLAETKHRRKVSDISWRNTEAAHELKQNLTIIAEISPLPKPFVVSLESIPLSDAIGSLGDINAEMAETN